MTPLEVRRDIAGSYVVVFFPMNPWSRDRAYIDARKGGNVSEISHIEYVRGGQVRHYEPVPNARAPERIMEMVRNILKGNPP